MRSISPFFHNDKTRNSSRIMLVFLLFSDDYLRGIRINLPEFQDNSFLKNFPRISWVFLRFWDDFCRVISINLLKFQDNSFMVKISLYILEFFAISWKMFD